MPKCLLYGGKGGVGKTTCASASALARARRGDRTLVISTDPAHSLGDVFDAPVKTEPTPVCDDRPLYAVEVDPETRLGEKYAETFDTLVGEIERLGVDLPTRADLDARSVVGSDELAAVDLFGRYAADDDWDRVVFDTAPTGHTLRLLRLPRVLDSTLGRAAEIKSRVDAVTSTVTGLFSGDDTERLAAVDIDGTRNRIERVAETLHDPERTQFRAVMEPERLSLRETERLLDRLREEDIPVDCVVANKVLEDIDGSCSLCSARRERQADVLSAATDRFDAPLVTVPLLEAPADERVRAVADRFATDDTV